MGRQMTCVTTPNCEVTHGDANTPKNRCVTTTTPKGVGVVVMHALPVSSEVTQNARGDLRAKPSPTGRAGPSQRYRMRGALPQSFPRCKIHIGVPLS